MQRTLLFALVMLAIAVAYAHPTLSLGALSGCFR